MLRLFKTVRSAGQSDVKLGDSDLKKVAKSSMPSVSV